MRIAINSNLGAKQSIIDRFKRKLKGFKNFPLNGKEVAFKAKKEKVFNVEMDVVTDETLKVIPLYAINELASVIWGENQVGEDLEKN